MIITNLIFEAYLNCPLKCFLLSTNARGATDSYDRWVGMENASYRHTLEKRLAAEIPPSECLIHPEAIKNVKAAKWQLVLGVTLRQRNLESDLHAIKRIPSKGRETPNVRFVPIRFSFANKLTKNDKLVLAFDALVLASSLGIPISYGEIIHGDGCIVTKVKTNELLKEVRKTAAKMESILSEGTPPGLFLNRHCTECEYQRRCRQEAIEKDDLTLLAGMTEQERKALAGRGIFTVTQLSYAFRPRRKAKRYQNSREKYHTSLKALSIREQKIHVVGSDTLQIEGIPVYLDAEALPDKDFYYLVGLRVGGVQHVLWADSKEHERRIWHDLLAIVSDLVHPVIVHYGAFDAAFLKNMCDRYGSPETESVKKSMGNPINLLSFIFARIYFPTYSNGLKDIGRHLGFHWSEENPSGIKTAMWRSEWERTHEPTLKERLITYNTEDCLALQRVTEFVAAISSADNESTPNQEIVRADTLPRRSWFKWGKTRYVMPDLGEIGKAAYWDYQQEKIILKSNPRLKETRKVTARPPGAKVRPNKTIQCPAPDACVRCGYPTPYRHYKYSKEIIDVRFGRSGLRKWITRYETYYYRCRVCRAVFYDPDRPWDGKKYGRNLLLLCAYLNIDLRIPQKRIAVFLKEILGFDFSNNTINKLKEKAARLYRETYERLLNKVINGKLIHADETAVNLEGRTGYVWVFASLEEVVYVYTPSRESDLVQRLLKDFKGVLVTDFYAAYDSIPCRQQKCLLHLVRDLNDDLIREPFNEEIKGLVADFASLVRPMVETVSRFGLKAHFLKRHKKRVDVFFKNLSRRTYRTETAVKCKARFEKNQRTLFTFLDYDGVPWNNNNAEHAIKTIALLRRNLAGLSTERALGDSLILLSACETCRFKGVSFLDFLRSGMTDIDDYVSSRTKHSRGTAEGRQGTEIGSPIPRGNTFLP